MCSAKIQVGSVCAFHRKTDKSDELNDLYINQLSRLLVNFTIINSDKKVI